MLEGSVAMGEMVNLCEPKIVSAYPITPQTHIVEHLAKLHAQGKYKGSYITAASEFGAISIIAGASATGVRAFTASGSQGIALMNEVLHAMPGMRLPSVMIVANRSLNSPLGIWNDHQDSISERDTGWLQFYMETNQEAVDFIPQAFKIAEKALLPVMICVDGFYLTHTIEAIDILEKEKIKKFLPEYNAQTVFLDPERPRAQGNYAFPEHQTLFKKEQWDAIENAKKIIPEIAKEFEEICGRRQFPFLEEYKNNRTRVIVAMGSITTLIKDVIDRRDDIGLIRLKCYRPFPKEELKKALEGKEEIIVFDKNCSYGIGGALYSEIHMCTKNKIVGWIVGMGGKLVTKQQIEKIINEPKQGVQWLV
jgi:pyruvate ferredoxin oxidoreductase alpha subunit